MTKTETVRARIAPKLKREAETILLQLGLTSSDAIQLFYNQIKMRRGIPFDVVIPNELTAETLRKSRRGEGVRHFGSKKELFADLGL